MHILQESGLLRWNAGLMGVSLTFRRHHVPTKFQETPNNTMAHHTTPESTTQLLWKPQIKHIYCRQDKNKKQRRWGEMT